MAPRQFGIELLPAEQLLREFLLECSQLVPGLEIWITGGWVRDRLLGIASSDLDLALNNLTGKDFVAILQAFLARPEIVSKYSEKAACLGISQPYFSRAHIAKKNPKMSKKLETAGCILFGLDVDLVNLRKEVYDGKSRNPDMEFGTAAEDAFRRDATVNALFFHLESQEVVDFTGRGIKDLDARIMRTPLDPKQTLMDDPLRVLRLVRVASKLGFSIAPETARCMQDPEVHRALDTIITRDRVGAELDKMMTSSNTETAFDFLLNFRLYSPIFVRPESMVFGPLAAQQSAWGMQSGSSPWPATWPLANNMLGRILAGQNNLSHLVRSYESIEHLWLLAAYSPLASLRQTLRKEIVREAASSVKASAKATKLLDDSLGTFDLIRTMVNSFESQAGQCCSRSECGMAIRSWGTTWIAQLTYTMLAETLRQDTAADRTSSFQASFSERLLEKYANFADFVLDQKLQNAVLERPLLNGMEIQELFGLHEGGKYLGTVIENVLRWQFDDAEATKENCKDWLLQEKDSLGLPTSS